MNAKRLRRLGFLLHCFCIAPLKQEVPDASICNFTFINLIISGDDFNPKFTSQAEIIFKFFFGKIHPYIQKEILVDATSLI